MSSDPWTILNIPQATWMSGTFVPTPAQWDTLFVAKADHSELSSYAPLLSPAFNGSPTSPTPGVGDSSGNIATTSFVAASYAPLASPTFTGTVSIPGAITGSNAAAGKVGEFVSAFLVAANAVAMTTATPMNILSLALSPGDWDVQGNGLFTGTALPTAFSVWLNTVSAALPAASANGMPLRLSPVTMNGPGGGPTGQLRVNTAAATTVYLSAQGTFPSGTMAGYGAITARRMR
ncbi:MAG TPA: hypothetical protein VGL12_15395 [Roseiarcus sp.]|jgi:hypothetical protein